jgi:hypothetical protein
MSLLSEVAVSLRTAGAELPLPEVRRAAQDVDLASRRLALVVAAGQTAPVRALGAALEHLDSAAGALLLAQHAIQGYLAAVGVLPVPAPSTVDDPVRSNWWAARVFEVTAVSPDPVSCERLLEEAVTRARDGDRDGLAAVLAGAEPAVGLGLASGTAPLVARLAGAVEHPGRAWDGVRHLVPELPSGVAAAILAGTPRRPWEEHPADRSIAGTVLLAGLLNLLGRKGINE